MFIGDGDPIVGLLAVLCGIVWIATTPAATSLDPLRKPPMLIRLK